MIIYFIGECVNTRIIYILNIKKEKLLIRPLQSSWFQLITNTDDTAIPLSNIFVGQLLL